MSWRDSPAWARFSSSWARCANESVISAFVKEEYWSLTAKLTAPPSRKVFSAALVSDENGKVKVGELGKSLYLDCGTLTPLLKKMEGKGLLSRRRSEQDERSLIVTLTEKGEALKDQALSVPYHMAACVHLEPEEIRELYRLLYKLLK